MVFGEIFSNFQFSESRFLKLNGGQSFISLEAVDLQPTLSITFQINRVGYLFSITAICKIRSEFNYIGAGAADWSDQACPFIRLVKVRTKVECCRSLDHFHEPLSYQDPILMHYELQSMANKMESSYSTAVEQWTYSTAQTDSVVLCIERLPEC